jgi:site-specific recombinase XerD
MHVVDVSRVEAARRLQVRRLVMPSAGVESWTLIGADLRPVTEVDEYLAWLTHNERSPNTIEAYAHDLKLFWSYLVERGLDWTAVGVMEISEFAAWARQPAVHMAVLRDETARRSAKTVNRVLTAVVGFYEFHGRRGNDLAKQLVVETRSGWGGHRPFLSGIAPQRRRGRAVRLPVQQELPKTLTLEQIAAVIDAQQHLRDRFLFALLASTGMRIGQALALRHEDVIAWERRIRIRARADDARRARSKGGGQGSVPVPGELVRLWSDYMHDEYGDLDSDFVFVNLWAGEIGRQLTYLAVTDLVRRTSVKVGFEFTPHMFRHTYATLAYRDGVALEVIGALLTHRSPSSTLIYTHPTAEDLRSALAKRGVLAKVEDLLR